ncbi:MAG: hypothetical protein WAO76_18205, partial [Georgfuchsia sp.]
SAFEAESAMSEMIRRNASPATAQSDPRAIAIVGAPQQYLTFLPGGDGSRSTAVIVGARMEIYF